MILLYQARKRDVERRLFESSRGDGTNAVCLKGASRGIRLVETTYTETTANNNNSSQKLDEESGGKSGSLLHRLTSLTRPAFAISEQNRNT